MEHLLAYHVVKLSYDAKVQLPVTCVHGVTSRVDTCRWLNSGLSLPLIERMFIYELGICKAYLAGTE